MALVSIYTVGRLSHAYDHPASREFYEMGYKVMLQASVSGHLITEFSLDSVPIPEEAKGIGYPVLTLTVWKSIESLYRFTYQESIAKLYIIGTDGWCLMKRNTFHMQFGGQKW